MKGNKSFERRITTVTFKEFFHLIYIRGYFEKQPVFLLDFLKESVDNPDMIIFSEPALNGYIMGDPIGTIAKSLKDAGYSREKLVKYIEKLYPMKHKDTKTYNNNFKGKTYKEALCERVAEKYSYVMSDGISDFLADCFNDIITEAEAKLNESTNEKNSTNKRQANANDVNSKIIHSYTITENEKNAITNICELILPLLSGLSKTVQTINRLHSMIDRCNDEEWKCDLQNGLIKKQKLYDEHFISLKRYCTAIATLLESKIYLNVNINDIYAISKEICDSNYIITQDEIDYKYYKNMLNRFKDNYQSLLTFFNSF